MSTGCDGSGEKMGQISRSVTDARCEMDSLENNVSILVDRLVPILNLEDVEDEPDKVPPTPVAPLADVVRDLSFRVHRCNMKLISVLNRIEL